MHDQEKCISVPLAYAETRAAAHQLRAITAPLVALAHLLPLPPAPELEALLEDATEETLKRLPLLSLHIDLDSIVRDELLPAAAALEEAGRHEA